MKHCVLIIRNRHSSVLLSFSHKQSLARCAFNIDSLPSSSAALLTLFIQTEWAIQTEGASEEEGEEITGEEGGEEPTEAAVVVATMTAGRAAMPVTTTMVEGEGEGGGVEVAAGEEEAAPSSRSSDVSVPTLLMQLHC